VLVILVMLAVRDRSRGGRRHRPYGGWVLGAGVLGLAELGTALKVIDFRRSRSPPSASPRFCSDRRGLADAGRLAHAGVARQPRLAATSTLGLAILVDRAQGVMTGDVEPSRAAMTVFSCHWPA
jgi:hypothetical protein